jgi:hypothetical protein
MIPASAPGDTYQGLGYYRSAGLGPVSEELASFISSEATDSFQLPIMLRAKFDTVLELRRVFQESSAGNWDGEGAEPISDATYQEASRLIRLLPVIFPMPEVTPMPNGQIGLEWYLARNRTFVVAVGGNQVLTYAGRFASDRSTHGTERFMDSLSASVVSNLQRLYREP